MTASPNGSLLEDLGFGADSTVAVVHVDDIGMCHAANEGGFETLRNGPATCGSVMVPCPWFAEAAAMARETPEVDLGVHLTLNAEWENYRWGPVAGRGAVPSLCAPDGGLYRTIAETVQHGAAEEVEIELRAQIDRALEAGIDVTHLDSHMGTVFFPAFFDVYLKLAREYRLPVFVPRPRGAQAEARLPEGQGRDRMSEALAGFEADGFPVFDGFCADSLSFAPGKGAEHNAGRIANLGAGLNYLICHAAQGGEELSAIAPEAHCRDFERTFYGGESGRQSLFEAGVGTVGMRAIRDAVRAGAS